MSSFPLRLPDDPKAQAAAAGISLNQYIAVALASRVGAQAEAQLGFAARAARAMPGQARNILARAGQGNPPGPGDELLDEPLGKSRR